MIRTAVRYVEVSTSFAKEEGTNTNTMVTSVPSPPGRVVRLHLACRANLPIGSSLRVTGAHLWDPAGNIHNPNDPTDARFISASVGREAYDAGDSGFAGGSLGIGANNVVDEDEAAVTGSGMVTPMGRDLVQPGDSSAEEQDVAVRNALMGMHDSRAPWYASSVEMVTSPETYPIWRTKRPVVIVLTDRNDGSSGMDDGDGDGGPSYSGVYHHRYRYLVVTPGAETSGAHGLLPYSIDSDMDDIKSLLNKTKISTGSLLSFGGGGTLTSSDVVDVPGTGSSWPVTLWENPFLPEEEGDEEMNDIQRESSMISSLSKGSVHSATSLASNKSGTRNTMLANLPYRTLDIDVATTSVIRPSTFSARSNENTMEDDSCQCTSDGVLIDSWNNCHDVTYRPYRLREGIKAEAERVEEMTSSQSEGDTLALEGSKKCRIFIVCYHLPVIVSKNPENGSWEACWAESLLAKTSGSFDPAFEPHRVGTVTTNTPITSEADKEALSSLLATMNCTVLFFDDAIRDAHYKGFCKQVLWLAFHHVDILDMHDPAFAFDLNAASAKNQCADGSLCGLRSTWDQSQIGPWWEAYNIVNRTFAVEVAKMVGIGDVVWVHDYHLSLLPRMLRNEEQMIQRPLTKTIFFLHIPFPVSMIFKEMECGAAVLEGMLHADVVGFHGFTDARHFLSSAKRILGLSHESLAGGLIGVKYGGRTVVVTMSSVSIEPDMVDGTLVVIIMLTLATFFVNLTSYCIVTDSCDAPPVNCQWRGRAESKACW